MILLDTHIWLWWSTDISRLKDRQRSAISNALDREQPIGVCSLSSYEIAMAVSRGRIEIKVNVERWLEEAFFLPNVVKIELSPRIAVEASRLPRSFPGDPFDRMNRSFRQNVELPHPVARREDHQLGTDRGHLKSSCRNVKVP